MEKNIKFPNLNFSQFKGVLLDLDNTIYDYDYCNVKAISKCHQLYKKKINFKISLIKFTDLYREARKKITKRLKYTGSCRSRLFAFQMIFENLKLEKNWELAEQFDKLYWNTFIKNMQISTDAKFFLANCKRFKIKVCIVSDMISSIQIKKLKQLKIQSHIKYLVTSEEVGFEKPKQKIFKVAINKLNLKKNLVIMIGDDYKKDFLGGKKFGLKSYKVKKIK